MESSLREVLLARIPDAPRTVEMRALLALAQTECRGSVDGAVIANASRHVMALVGDPEGETIAWALEELATPVTALSLHRPCAKSHHDASRLPWRRATVMTLADPSRLAAVVSVSRPRVVPLTLEHLAHVPIDLGEELVSALDGGVVTCALAEDDLPASFAYAPFETESLFDVSVETLRSHHGHGHATCAAAVLIDALCATGRAPVWSAHDDNLASIAVAMKLGMAPVSHLWIAHIHNRSR